jgi:hypothetical protein
VPESPGKPVIITLPDGREHPVLVGGVPYTVEEASQSRAEAISPVTYEWVNGGPQEAPMVRWPEDRKNLRDKIAKTAVEWLRRASQAEKTEASERPMNYYGGIFTQPPPGVDWTEHLRIIDEWAAEEALAASLHAGSAFASVQEAFLTVTARRLIQILQEANAHLEMKGDKLWIGPASAVAPEIAKMVPLVKEQIIREIS